MKNKKACAKAMDMFFELDKNERIPLSLISHIIFCKHCRKAVHLCTMAEKASAKPLQVPLPLSDKNLHKILRQINPSLTDAVEQSFQHISMRRWILAGACLCTAILFFSLFGLNKAQPILQISLYLCFAICITAYCAFFIGGNMDFFVKKIKTSNF